MVFPHLCSIAIYVIFQNAGAIIGKGGSNIKRLRADVSIIFLTRFLLSKNQETSLENICRYIILVVKYFRNLLQLLWER